MRQTLLLLLIGFGMIRAQPLVFKSKDGRYGMSLSGKVVAPAIYDTIYMLDPAGSICLGCQLKITTGNNKLFKVTTRSYYCHYRNGRGEVLRIRTENNDTNSVFTLTKNTITQGLEGPFAVAVHTKKYLVDKTFKQLTFKGHNDVMATEDPNYYVIEEINEAENRFAGLVDKTEKVVFPAKYSGVHVNLKDSLMVLCSAGIKSNSEDEVYTYQKKKIYSSYKHIHLATAKFIILEVFEPEEYFVIVNLSNRVEKQLKAQEVVYHSTDEVMIRLKNTWYIYNLLSGEKKQIKKK